MHKHIRTALATTAAAALTGGLLAVAAGAASATVTGAKVDFNGDGYADVAVSAGNAYVSGKKGAGQIVALYGSASGLSSSKRKTISQNTTGVPGSAETNAGFGWVSAIGDFNGDGFSDLAVGAPLDNVGTDTDGGSVAILWGSTGGLTGGTAINDPAASSHDRWGQSLAAADYDGDGTDDLAIGSNGATIYVYKGGIDKSGTPGSRSTVKPAIMSGGDTGPLNLTAGDVNGDRRADLVVDGYETTSTKGWNANYYLPGTASGLTTSNAVKLSAGIITGIGDVNGDGYGDIVTGMQWDATSGVPGTSKGGKVKITYGSASGPAASTSFTQNSGAVPGDSETSDYFGNDLALGDINGDGFQDLAVGSQGEDIGSDTNTGSVTVLFGSPTGIDTTNGIQYFTQDRAGVPGSNEDNDNFGSDVHLDDVNGDGTADLTIGAYGENAFDGSITGLLSNATRITTTGAVGISASAAGVSTTGSPVLGGNFAN
jgi:hypothetical protein